MTEAAVCGKFDRDTELTIVVTSKLIASVSDPTEIKGSRPAPTVLTCDRADTELLEIWLTDFAVRDDCDSQAEAAAELAMSRKKIEVVEGEVDESEMIVMVVEPVTGKF
jgi:hypothetical protein